MLCRLPLPTAANGFALWVTQSVGKKGKLALELTVDGKPVTLYAERDGQSGNAFRIRFSWSDGSVTFASILDAVGEIPIPPYLNRNTEPSDTEDYQTVYSHIEGSVAAPTAGLHFTERTLADLDRRGIRCRELTLHVGAGTFQPVKSEVIGEHEMHTEFISVTRSLVEDLLNARARSSLWAQRRCARLRACITSALPSTTATKTHST